MGEQNEPSPLETHGPFLGSANDSYYVVGHELNDPCMDGAGVDGIRYVPLPSPHCMHHQQTPQDYVEFLTENVVSEGQMDGDASAASSGFSLLDGSADMVSQEQTRYKRAYYEGVPFNYLTSSELEHQTRVQKQELRHASAPCSEASAAGSYRPSRSSKKLRAALNDKCRRMKISERIEALGELFPCSKKGGEASQLDEIIDHIKYLQFQIKDLSRNRLGGEPTSTPFVFLEGCGHYVLDQLLIGPLEETMGKLLEMNPSLAIQLLENKDLFMMPAGSVGLHQHE